MSNVMMNVADKIMQNAAISVLRQSMTFEKINSSDLTIRKNILMFITGSDEEMMKNVEKTDGYDGFKGWHVIVAEDIRDAKEKFDDYVGATIINNLVISIHGSPGKMEITSGQFAIGHQTLKQYNEGVLQQNTFEKWRVDVVEAIKEVASHVQTGGNLIVTGCNAGKGDEGIALGDELIKLTGGCMNVYLNRDMSVYGRQLDKRTKPWRATGYGLLNAGEGKGLTDAKYLIGGWRKFNFDIKTGKTEMINLKDIKGRTGNIRLNIEGQGPPVQLL